MLRWKQRPRAWQPREMEETRGTPWTSVSGAISSQWGTARPRRCGENKDSQKRTQGGGVQEDGTKAEAPAQRLLFRCLALTRRPAVTCLC